MSFITIQNDPANRYDGDQLENKTEIKDQDIYKASGIIIQDRKVLVGRSTGKEFFINPGGKLEAGETAVQAVIRELKEEFQIDVHNGRI